MSETTDPDNHSAYEGDVLRCFACQAMGTEQVKWRDEDDHRRSGLLFGWLRRR